MIPRAAAVRLLRLLQGFPVVTVTGPQQSGKTTLVRTLLPELRPVGRLDAHCAGHLVKGFFPTPNSRVHARDLDPH